MQRFLGMVKTCYEFAKKNDFCVIGEYIDRATTGTNDNREQFKKMIAIAKKTQEGRRRQKWN